MAELADPALSREKAEAIAREAANRLWPSVQSEASMAAVILEALGRHFDIAPPELPKLVIDSGVERQVADLVEGLAPPSPAFRPSEREAYRNLIEQAIRERFDVRD